MPRFVILTHDHPTLHWDLMLEQQLVLRTWRLMSEPIGNSPIPAEQLPDHRLQYLNYEGPVSNNRGMVTQWDTGEFAWVADEPDLLKVHLQGKTIRSCCLLTRNNNETGWTFQIENESVSRSQ